VRGFEPKAWLWFLSSYGPLWIMLGLRFDCLGLRVGLIALGLASIALVARLVTRRAEEPASGTAITISGDAGSDVSGYLAAYLLPFLTVDAPGLSDLAAYTLFIAVAGLVYVRSGLMQINPTVYFVRRTVLRGTIDVGTARKDVFVITRRDLRVGDPLYAERFSDRVYIDHGKGR
jgi:hypothetical protein